MVDSSISSIDCPHCKNKIMIENRWYPGGVNDYGSFELKCLNCENIFTTYVGRDVDLSFVKSGAKIVKKLYE